MTGESNKRELLSSFCVFCDNLGEDEGKEKDKILFYHPKEISVDKQIRNIGLCQAIIKFTKTFTTDEACECLHTQKTKQYFYEPEPGYWMVMASTKWTLCFSHRMKEVEKLVYEYSTTLKVPSRIGSPKAGREVAVVDYLPNDVWDNVYQAVLRQAYQMFRLFSGRFATIVSECPAEFLDPYDYLRQRLDHFLPKYLASLHLSEADVSTLFQGIQFLPLDPHSFLKIHCLVNSVEEVFPGIVRSIFFYDDFLVWSGLEMEDMQVMYRYLTTGLFPSAGRAHEAAGYLGPALAAPKGFFMTGPSDLSNADNLGKIPRVIVRDIGKGPDFPPEEDPGGKYGEEHQLIVYRAKDTTICFLFEGSQEMDINLFRKLDAFLGHQLAGLSDEITESIRRKSQNTMSSDSVMFKYVYFNAVNCAMKSTMAVDAARKPVPTGPVDSFVTGSPPTEVLKFFPQLHQDLHYFGPNAEMSVKLHNDYWVVAKKADQREVYIVMSQRNMTLLETSDELNRLFASQFSNIF
ncbi:unnamed protein product, partial [Notodromas monacha]